MNIIVAVDDDYGMLFHNRRQSKDCALRKKIESLVQGKTLWMNAFSRKQFEEENIAYSVAEDFLNQAGQGEYCFVEDQSLLPKKEEVEELILFRWNRKYPSDFKLDLIPEKCGFHCTKTEEFVGNSHEKITLEQWIKA